MKHRLVVAFLLGTVASAALIGAAARGDVDRMTLGDGLIHRYVALRLTTPADQIEPAIVASGTSLRYGRIGWPVALYLTSGGSEDVIRFTQPLLTALAGGAAVAAIAALFPGAVPAAWMLVFVAPGFTLSLAGGFAEVPALALALWGLVAALRARWWWAAGAFALAMLTKESAIAVLAAAAIWAWLRGRPSGLRMGAAVIPVAAWYLVVRARYGHIPLLDPYVSGGRGVSPPVIGLWESITNAFSLRSSLVAILHVAIGVAMLPLMRRSVFGLAAGLAAALLLITTPHIWRFIGDGSRTSIFIEALAVLAVLAWRRPRWVAAGASLQVGEQAHR